jgi:hypothetical protein
MPAKAKLPKIVIKKMESAKVFPVWILSRFLLEPGPQLDVP